MRQGYLRQPSDKANLVDTLVRGMDAKVRLDAPFENYRDLYVFAAYVGFTHDRQTPIIKTDRDPVRWSVLVGRIDFEGLLYLFGVATGDPMILAEDRTQELLQLFEAYYNGGLEIIQEWITDAGGISPIEVISTQVLSQMAKRTGTEGQSETQLVVPEL